jgi:nucleoid-associated protein EbfC
MKDIMGMMKQAQELQSRMQRVQDDLAAAEVEGRAGGGLVRLTLDGKGQMKRIVIDPSLMKAEETEVLEDLILAASQDAKTKVEALMQAKMKEATGGLALPPGLSNLF